MRKNNWMWGPCSLRSKCPHALAVGVPTAFGRAKVGTLAGHVAPTAARSSLGLWGNSVHHRGDKGWNIWIKNGPFRRCFLRLRAITI
ncbi:MAG: hypothetical protein HY037_03150 [Nitrospirae bacterium]|nr:hypothetical protein [Candidatus Troglogloeales bacterium]